MQQRLQEQLERSATAVVAEDQLQQLKQHAAKRTREVRSPPACPPARPPARPAAHRPTPKTDQATKPPNAERPTEEE
jgi:hypothetical protein